MNIQDLIKKSQDGFQLKKDELIYLLGLRPDSSESYFVMA